MEGEDIGRPMTKSGFFERLERVNASVLKVVSLIVIGLFFCTLLSGIFLPVYSDEVMTKWSNARFFFEAGKLVSFFPQCAATTERAVSWVFYPAAILISSVYAHLEPLGLRVSGITLSGLWFFLLAFWCLKQTNDRASGIQRFSGLVAFASLGVMPYLWVLSRPEQMLILPVLFFCLTAFYFKQAKSLTVQTIFCLLFIVVVSCFFYVHPKSLFFSPFILVAIWLSTASYERVFRYALVLFVCAMCFQVYQETSALAACQDAPYIQSMLKMNTLLPGMLFSAPAEFLSAALNNVISFPDKMLMHLVFRDSPQSGWLPPMGVSGDFLPFLNTAIRYLLYIFVIGSHFAAVLVFLVQVVRLRVSAPVLLAVMLSLADFLNVLFYNIWNFYAGTQFVPISIVIIVLLLQLCRELKVRGVFVVSGYIFASICATSSLVVLLSAVMPSIIQNSSSSQSSLPGQPLSIPVFGAQSHIDSIKRLGKTCDLPEELAENIVLDHMTYFAYVRDKKPIHVLYVSELGYGGDLANGKLFPFLKGLKSPGVITRCEWMPSELRKAQTANDMGYCCVNLE